MRKSIFVGLLMILFDLPIAVRFFVSMPRPVFLIGEQSGIPSRATLARLFRTTYGMSCSEYRQVVRQKYSCDS